MVEGDEWSTAQKRQSEQICIFSSLRESLQILCKFIHECDMFVICPSLCKRVTLIKHSQHPHVVVGDIILLQPWPFVKLQILNVFCHLRSTYKIKKYILGLLTSKKIFTELLSNKILPSQYLGLGFHHKPALLMFH